MRSVSENLKDFAEEIKLLLRDLLLNHCTLQHREDGRMGEFKVLYTSGDRIWAPLSDTGRRLQSKALEEYRRFIAILQSLLKEQPKSARDDLKENDEAITRIIEQEPTWSKSRQEVLAKVIEALDAQVALLAGLYDSSTGAAIYVPDTNALLANPQLEDWRFNDTPQFTFVCTPTVLAELDKHKVAHKNQRVRKTTESLIGRMKEYRRRGRLTDGDGVTLVRNVSRFVALAVEPDLENSLPWLDASNNDDQILASFVEVMRRYPRSPVILVTRDFNLQNKAEFARLSFVEPPDKPRPKVRKDFVSGEVEHKKQ